MRQYGVNYLVGSVLTTVVLTLALVVAVAAVWMRHGGRSITAGVLHHTHPVVDDAREDGLLQRQRRDVTQWLT